MNIKCIIIDDEPLAIEVIESHVNKVDNLEHVGSFRNAIKAFDFIQQNEVDLIFLDIQMPKLTGIEFLKTLSNPPKVIFTTAYRDYALEGFELEVVDYLLKPIAFERFLKAVSRVFEISHEENKTNSFSITSTDDEAFVYFKVDKRMVKIRLNDILVIESIKDYVKVKTAEKEIVTHQQISYLEHKLPEDKFLRIHRSFIVAIDKIDAFSATEVEINKKYVPIGRNYKNEVIEKLSVNTL
ncbi:MAG: response regulator transcription factor [Cyclobacteriaceae bacterium]